MRTDDGTACAGVETFRQIRPAMTGPIPDTPSGRAPIDADWRGLLAESCTVPEWLPWRLRQATGSLRSVVDRYPMRINPYYLSLIQTMRDPIGLQAIPSPAELDSTRLDPDPSGEGGQSPSARIVHRYPDRVVFLVSDRCPVYCRFCMRKRQVGDPAGISPSAIDDGLAYIRENRQVEEVVLSGGDPLMLSDDRLSGILDRLRSIRHVQVIRIHSRMPCTLPQRITTKLASRLARFHPLFVVTHFNHPRELTAEAAAACGRLVDAGIPLGSQSVLLRGVNDDPGVMASLMKGLVRMRIRPYYLHHPDPVRGTAHFRVPIRTGQEVMRRLRGNISGLCVPQYMIDLPGGGGKVPMLPETTRWVGDGRLEVENYRGERYIYEDVPEGEN
ncbi:MAG: KamA family radical SAM protein [Desulfobacterales bacterium]